MRWNLYSWFPLLHEGTLFRGVTLSNSSAYKEAFRFTDSFTFILYIFIIYIHQCIEGLNASIYRIYCITHSWITSEVRGRKKMSFINRIIILARGRSNFSSYNVLFLPKGLKTPPHAMGRWIIIVQKDAADKEHKSTSSR